MHGSIIHRHHCPWTADNGALLVLQQSDYKTTALFMANSPETSLARRSHLPTMSLDDSSTAVAVIDDGMTCSRTRHLFAGVPREQQTITTLTELHRRDLRVAALNEVRLPTRGIQYVQRLTPTHTGARRRQKRAFRLQALARHESTRHAEVDLARVGWC